VVEAGPLQGRTVTGRAEELQEKRRERGREGEREGKRER